MVNDAERDVGPIIYNWLSGAIHGDVATWLLGAEADANAPRGKGGSGVVQLAVSSKSVALTTIAALSVHLSAFDSLMMLTGSSGGDRATAQARVDAAELIAALNRSHGWD